MTDSSFKRLVDFHCHLDLYPNYEATVAERERDGVFSLTMTTTPKAWPRNLQVTKSTQHVRAALGLHPQLVGERSHEISLWREYLSQTRYIGEVGLDAGPRFYRSYERQKEIFEEVLSACAHSKDKILSIHSVRSAKLVIDMIDRLLPPTHGKTVLHWFTGSSSEAKKASELGCYFSVNSNMLSNERGRKLVKSLPIGRLLTETDGPFTGDINKQTGAAAISQTIGGLARLFEEPIEVMETTIIENLKKLLQ